MQGIFKGRGGRGGVIFERFRGWGEGGGGAKNSLTKELFLKSLTQIRNEVFKFA